MAVARIRGALSVVGARQSKISAKLVQLNAAIATIIGMCEAKGGDDGSAFAPKLAQWQRIQREVDAAVATQDIAYRIVTK